MIQVYTKKEAGTESEVEEEARMEEVKRRV